jgi:hypothetical protein
MMFPNIICAFMVLLATQVPRSVRTIAFERNPDEIWVVDENGKNAKFICKGMSPAIDPSGHHIAYVYATANSRSIGFADIKKGTSGILRSIPGNNSFGPQWNRDGDRLLFFLHSLPGSMVGWRIGIVNPIEDSEFHVLGEILSTDLLTARWREDDNSVICIGGTTVYRFSANGNLEESYPATQLESQKQGSGPAGFYWFSSEGTSMVYETDMPGERAPVLPDVNSALFIKDLKSGKSKRITPKDICAMRPVWLSANLILFDGFTAKDIKIIPATKNHDVGYDITRSLYFVDKDGKHLRRFIDNASWPSASRTP